MANLPALARFSFFPSRIMMLTASGRTEKFLHTALVMSCTSPLFWSTDLPSSATTITSGLLIKLVNYNIHIPRATAVDLNRLKYNSRGRQPHLQFDDSLACPLYKRTCLLGKSGGQGYGGTIDGQLSQNTGKDSASLAHVSAVFISKLFKHHVLFTSYPKYIDRNNNN